MTDLTGNNNLKVSGTWGWVIQSRQGRPDRPVTLKVNVAGDKITGTVTSQDLQRNEYVLDIKEGQINGDKISFNTTRNVDGKDLTTKYSGTVSGDTIRGRMDFIRNGEPMNRDWVAKRSTDAK